MVIARSCSLIAVADTLAQLMGQSYNTLRVRLRDNNQGTFRRLGRYHWKPFFYWVAAVGRDGEPHLRERKANFAARCLGYWGEEHQDPWLVLTDLAPE